MSILDWNGWKWPFPPLGGQLAPQSMRILEAGWPNRRWIKFPSHHNDQSFDFTLDFSAADEILHQCVVSNFFNKVLFSDLWIGVLLLLLCRNQLLKLADFGWKAVRVPAL